MWIRLYLAELDPLEPRELLWWTLRRRDHGDGLPPSAIPHLFDRFYKADTARARSEGSGLGLAIAWENARLHGGRIDAGNHPDGGAIFTVSLPVNEPGTKRRGSGG